jgi:hypothetical protein
MSQAHAATVSAVDAPQVSTDPTHARLLKIPAPAAAVAAATAEQGRTLASKHPSLTAPMTHVGQAGTRQLKCS